jgi:hypothetical protein
VSAAGLRSERGGLDTRVAVARDWRDNLATGSRVTPVQRGELPPSEFRVFLPAGLDQFR